MLFSRNQKLRSRDTRKQEHHFGWQIFRGVLRFLAIALILTLTWYVTRLPFFTIQEVTFRGGETIHHEELRTLVETELTGAHFLVVPKRFTYAYPKERIVEVLEGVSRVHNVMVEREGRTKLQITFDEYIPYALVCREGDSSPCWFINETGYAFAPAPQLQGGTFVRHIIKREEEFTRGQVIEPERLQALTQFVQRAETELLLRISELIYRDDGDIELGINGGGYILISGNKNLDTTFENLRIVLQSEAFAHLEPGNFKYVDVRFDNKVFVNEQLEQATTTEITLPE